MAKRILLLRHAEEPDGPDDLDLSEAGRKRAERLAAYVPETFGKAEFLFAAAPSTSSVRCYLTLRPLADGFGLRIDGTYAEREFGALASKLLADPAFDDTLVAVAWTHKQLPALPSALLVRREDFPGEWDKEVFDLIEELAYKRRSHPTVRRTRQPPL